MDANDISRLTSAPTGDGISLTAKPGGYASTPARFNGTINNVDVDKQTLTLNMVRYTGGLYRQSVNQAFMPTGGGEPVHYTRTFSFSDVIEFVLGSERVKPSVGPPPEPLTPEEQAALERWYATGECQPELTYYPNPEDANSFYQCVEGVPYLQLCPAGLVFNPTLCICDWPD